MKLEIDVPELPEGYEYTGEFRKARKGDYWLKAAGDIIECCVPTTMHPHLIVRKPKTDVEKLERKMQELYEVAYTGIQHVASANYTNREQEALRALEKVYYNWQGE